MVSAATLDIDIDVRVANAIADLEALAASLQSVAAAQAAVEENMTVSVDVETNKIDALESRLREGFEVVPSFRDPEGQFASREEALLNIDRGEGPIPDGGEIDRGEGPIPDGGRLRSAVDRVVDDRVSDRLSPATADFIGSESEVTPFFSTDAPTRSGFTPPEGVVRDMASGQFMSLDDDQLPVPVDVADSASSTGLPVPAETTRGAEVAAGQIAEATERLEKTEPNIGGLTGTQVSDSTSFGFNDSNFDLFGDQFPFNAGGQFKDINETLDQFNLSMTAVNNVVADFIPLLSALIAAAPSLAAGGVAVTGIGAGLGASLAAVGGLGVLGIARRRGQTLQKTTQEIFTNLRKSFIESFGPLADLFTPTVQDALQDLKSFFDNLASRGDVLLSLRDEFSALIDFVLPRTAVFLERVARAGEAAVPIFRNIGEFFTNTNIVRGFASVLLDTLPILSDLALALANGAGAIFRFSLGVAEAVNAFVSFIGVLTALFGILPNNIRTFGVLIGALAVLTSVASFTSSVVGALSFIVNSSLIPSLSQAIAGFLGLNASIFTAAAAAVVAAAAFVALISVLTAGLGALTSAIGGAAALGGSSATDDLAQFVKTGNAGTRGGRTVYKETNYNINARSVEGGKRIGRRQAYKEKLRTDKRLA